MDETSMDEFFDAIDSEDNHSDETTADEDVFDDVETSEQTAEKPDEPQEAAAEPVGEEKPVGENAQTQEETPAEANQETQTYVLRVNHEDKTVTREELMSYAQMGVDYSRVKAQLEQAKTDNTGLNAKIAEIAPVYDTIKDLADASGMTVDDLIRQFEVTRYKSQGYSDDAAKMAVERDRVIKERDALQAKAAPKPEEQAKERADREIQEFMQKYPDVSITEELVSKLSADVVERGLSFTEAYQKLQREEQEARIKTLEAELAAAKQNSANRASSPGSVSDTGTKRKRDAFDDFFDNY